MTAGAFLATEPAGAAAVVALLDCSAKEAAGHIASLEHLAGQLGATVRTERVSAACTTLSVRIAPDLMQRFQAALLLGGAAILTTDGHPDTDLTVIVTISAPTRSE